MKGKKYKSYPPDTQTHNPPGKKTAQSFSANRKRKKDKSLQTEREKDNNTLKRPWMPLLHLRKVTKVVKLWLDSVLVSLFCKNCKNGKIVKLWLDSVLVSLFFNSKYCKHCKKCKIKARQCPRVPFCSERHYSKLGKG